MKQFLLEYGLTIFAAVVTITLIAMATPIGGSVRKAIDNTIFSYKNTMVERPDYGAFVKIYQEEDDDKFFIHVNTKFGDENTYLIEYRIDSKTSGWTDWHSVSSEFEVMDGLIGRFEVNVNNGEKIQARILNKNELDSSYIYSDIITYTHN